MNSPLDENGSHSLEQGQFYSTARSMRCNTELSQFVSEQLRRRRRSRLQDPGGVSGSRRKLGTTMPPQKQPKADPKHERIHCKNASNSIKSQNAIRNLQIPPQGPKKICTRNSTKIEQKACEGRIIAKIGRKLEKLKKISGNYKKNQKIVRKPEKFENMHRKIQEHPQKVSKIQENW
jgi:hypothetical protein